MSTLAEQSGRLIQAFDYYDHYGNPHQWRGQNGDTARLSHEYYGDHTENWIVLENGGREVGRFKASGVEAIFWAENGAKQ